MITLTDLEGTATAQHDAMDVHERAVAEYKKRVTEQMAGVWEKHFPKHHMVRLNWALYGIYYPPPFKPFLHIQGIDIMYVQGDTWYEDYYKVYEDEMGPKSVGPDRIVIPVKTFREFVLELRKTLEIPVTVTGIEHPEGFR
jgi:hypothetical protein